MSSWVFCLADSDLYELPFFNPDDYFFSPDIISESTNIFKTPDTSFHIADFIQSKPELRGIKPDFVFIKTDATRRNLIKGLSRLDCPSFVSIADTHHLYRPLETMIDYIKNENYTFISAENDRHHLKWYKRAGFNNLCWIPNVALYPQIISRQVEDSYKYEIVFVGSLGKFHPFRGMVVDTLRANFKNRFHVGSANQREASKIYNSSLISINVSLNSDLNWRFFEIIAAGGFLLTDRLPKNSGINNFFEEGVHFDAYSSDKELIEKVDFYLKNPIRAIQIAKQGHQKYIECLKPSKLRSEVIKISFALNQSNFSIYTSTKENLQVNDLITLRAYQSFQELHRLNSKVILLHQNTLIINSLIEDLKDFPRINAINIDTNRLPKKSILAEIDSYSYNRKSYGAIAIEDNQDLRKFQSIFEACSAIVKVKGDYDRKILNLGANIIFAYHSTLDCYVRS